MDPGSELTIISGNSKYYCGTLVRVAIYGSQVINGFRFRTLHSVPCGSLSPFCGNYPSSGMGNWNRYTRHPAESQNLYPDLWSEEYYHGKGHLGATRTATTTRNITNKIQDNISEGTEKISATIMDIKDAGVVNFITSPFNLSMCPA